MAGELDSDEVRRGRGPARDPPTRGRVRPDLGLAGRRRLGRVLHRRRRVRDGIDARRLPSMRFAGRRGAERVLPARQRALRGHPPVARRRSRPRRIDGDIRLGGWVHFSYYDRDRKTRARPPGRRRVRRARTRGRRRLADGAPPRAGGVHQRLHGFLHGYPSGPPVGRRQRTVDHPASPWARRSELKLPRPLERGVHAPSAGVGTPNTVRPRMTISPLR